MRETERKKWHNEMERDAVKQEDKNDRVCQGWGKRYFHIVFKNLLNFGFIQKQKEMFMFVGGHSAVAFTSCSII